jgi:hypothetical protein
MEFANPAQRRLCYPCRPGPEPEPFVEVGLPFFAMGDGDRFPPGDDEPFSDSWPVISAGEVRFDTGPIFSFWVRYNSRIELVLG